MLKDPEIMRSAISIQLCTKHEHYHRFCFNRLMKQNISPINNATVSVYYSDVYPLLKLCFHSTKINDSLTILKNKKTNMPERFECGVCGKEDFPKFNTDIYHVAYNSKRNKDIWYIPLNGAAEQALRNGENITFKQYIPNNVAVYSIPYVTLKNRKFNRNNDYKSFQGFLYIPQITRDVIKEMCNKYHNSYNYLNIDIINKQIIFSNKKTGYKITLGLKVAISKSFSDEIFKCFNYVPLSNIRIAFLLKLNLVTSERIVFDIIKSDIIDKGEI